MMVFSLIDIAMAYRKVKIDLFYSGNRWLNIRAEERKAYQINAYRVLMTRARQGMVICVPEGNPEDATRLPAFYDGTYQYLKRIGIEEVVI